MTLWTTIVDLQDGIERFLMPGEQSLAEICKHAIAHGADWTSTIRNVHALRDAGRVEQIPARPPRYKIPDRRRAELAKEDT